MIVILRICCFILAAGLWNLFLAGHCQAGLAVSVNPYPVRILVRVAAIHMTETDVARLSVRILDAPADVAGMGQIMTLQMPVSLTVKGSSVGSGAEGESVSVKNLMTNDILHIWFPPRSISKDAYGNLAANHVIALERVTAAAQWTFSGIEKFPDMGILDAFLRPVRIPVIVTFKPFDIPENSGSLTPEEIAAQQDAAIEKLIQTLKDCETEGYFYTSNKLANLQVLSGRATLEGLKQLAAMPQVLAIEEDRPMQLHPQVPEAVNPLPEAVSGQEKGGSQ
jgi:hypothetical protein